jgi:regulator of sigma D
MSENLVTTMIQQHRGLQADVGAIVALYNGNDDVKAEAIFDGVNKFKTDLVEHLKLENESFYVELLEKMKQAKQDTAKTETFIAEMKDIEKVVYAFLEKFSTADSINNNFLEFKSEFNGIKEALTLRIEAEESGVYSYWGLF